MDDFLPYHDDQRMTTVLSEVETILPSGHFESLNSRVRNRNKDFRLMECS